MDCSLPGSSVHGILQAKMRKWFLQYSPSPAASRPSDQILVSYVSCIDRQVLYRERHLGSPYHTTNLYDKAQPL